MSDNAVRNVAVDIEKHNTDAELTEVYSQKAVSYDTFRAPSPGLSQILECLHHLATGLDILDLGCGTGSFFKHLHALEPKSMVAIDVNEAMVNQAKAKAIDLTGTGDWVLSGFSDILDSHSFDFIFCGQVIQNLTSDPLRAPFARARFYQEMMRLLRPGGRVVLTTRLVPTGGRWSDLYWYADPDVVPQAVESMEGVVPNDPKAELELAGFVDVTAHASVATDTMIRPDAYKVASYVSNAAYRAGDSFFQHVELKGELGQLLRNIANLEASGKIVEYTEQRVAMSKGKGQVVTLMAFKPLD